MNRNPNPIVGRHPLLINTRRLVVRVAPCEIPVLITGESGTGKELIAELIHDRSQRRSAPFVLADCSAFLSETTRTELFGHVRGAFTGAIHSCEGLLGEAEGGTLFLDEVGELPLDLQRQLLRFAQSLEYRRLGESRRRKGNVRIVAATNRDLEAEVRAGRFRLDLY